MREREGIKICSILKNDFIQFFGDSYNSETCVVPSLKSLWISTTGTPKILLGTIDVGSQSSLNIRHKDFDVDVVSIVLISETDEVFSCTIC